MSAPSPEALIEAAEAELNAEVAKGAETPDKAQESPADGKDEAGEDWEAQAARMGWKADFRGAGAVDAETFVKRGREILPFVQANNKALEKALKEARDETKALRKTFSDFQEHHTQTAQREYKRAMADLSARQAVAVENNDAKAVADITDEISDLKADMKAAPKTQADPNAAFNEAFETWKPDNAWFDSDKAMRAYAVELFGDYADHVPYARRLTEVTKAVKAEFPHKFAPATNPNRDLPGAVEGQGGPRGPRGKSYSDLPPDAKAMCDSFIKDIKGFTKEQFVKDYFGDAK